MTSTDSDHALVTAFEDCSLPEQQWTHRSHVRVAYLYAIREPVSRATDRMRRALQKYNATVDTPETVDRGYHETITRAFMGLIGDAIRRDGPFISAAAFCDAHPELLTKSVLRRYYSREHIVTMEAKQRFVEPDLQPLPAIDDADWLIGMKPFLESSEVIDCDHPSVRALAAELSGHTADETEYVRRAFEWVRDQIRHSIDYACTDVTCNASQVQAVGTGFCYAKSHLLAALLRARGIPTGFCYQRLSVGDSGPPYCLHGLNAVFLPELGWYRLDPRGNKPDVNAQFTPPVEQLAFTPSDSEEVDDLQIYAQPLPVVVESLQNAVSVQELQTQLPDVARQDRSENASM